MSRGSVSEGNGSRGQIDREAWASRVHDLAEKAWKQYKILNRAASKFKVIAENLNALVAEIRWLYDRLEENVTLSAENDVELRKFEKGCTVVLADLDRVVVKFRKENGAIAPEDIESFHTKVRKQIRLCASLRLFLPSDLEDRLAKALAVISAEVKVGTLPVSTLAEWSELEAQLIDTDFSFQDVEEERDFIENWLQEHLGGEEQTYEEEATPPKQLTPVFAASSAPGGLPGYYAGPNQPGLPEKSRSLSQATGELSLNPPEASGSSAVVEPPPYTFDAGIDLETDRLFAQQLHLAIEKENQGRKAQLLKLPSSIPRPWNWLPPQEQLKFQASGTVNPTMDLNSFSTMAYETAPRCIREIERLRGLIETTFSGTISNSPENSIVSEAFHALKVLSQGIAKFFLLQDQETSSSGLLSDLDAMDYEFSAVHTTHLSLEFPSHDFETAKSNYYQLLTHILAFLYTFASIYSGKSYISITRSEISPLWNEQNMTTRLAWMEKQLAVWENNEIAIRRCRGWRSTVPALRHEAIMALQDWESASQLFNDGTGEALSNIITIKLNSVSNMPKPSLRQLHVWARIVLYVKHGAHKDGALRAAKWESRGAEKKISNRKFEEKVLGEEAVHFFPDGESFLIEVPQGMRAVNLKFIDIELLDRLAGIDRELGRLRMMFGKDEGGITFAGKSLRHDYDDETDFALDIHDNKGKSKGEPTINVRLSWQGREGHALKMGLPIHPPGSMFKLHPQTEDSLIWPSRVASSSEQREKSGSMANIFDS